MEIEGERARSVRNGGRASGKGEGVRETEGEHEVIEMKGGRDREGRGSER